MSLYYSAFQKIGYWFSFLSITEYYTCAGARLSVHDAGHHPGEEEGGDDAPHLENKQSHGEIIILTSLTPDTIITGS